jgi:hypothetical protein
MPSSSYHWVHASFSDLSDLHREARGLYHAFKDDALQTLCEKMTRSEESRRSLLEVVASGSFRRDPTCETCLQRASLAAETRLAQFLRAAGPLLNTHPHLEDAIQSWGGGWRAAVLHSAALGSRSPEILSKRSSTEMCLVLGGWDIGLSHGEAAALKHRLREAGFSLDEHTF